MAVTFFDDESTQHNTVDKDQHAYAEPEECEKCVDEKKKIAELEKEVAELK